ncbi:hypothetical protein CSC74_03935 [Pseudoxanthomonas yeongjuensis]|nr:hypothetical protein CSC74_03935 [Pseudoxanthomonas yeongjuensis]
MAYAQSTTIITSLPYEIRTPGTYVLANDLVAAVNTGSSAISIYSSDVTLDCLGHSITDSVRVAGSRGVVGYADLSDVTIQNCTLSNFDGGITVGERNYRPRLIRNRILDGGVRGIMIRGHNAFVSENRVIGLRTISAGTSTGMVLTAFDGNADVLSEDAVISHNVVADVRGDYQSFGITVTPSIRPVIADNSILDIRPNTEAIVYLYFYYIEQDHPGPTVGALIRNNVMMSSRPGVDGYEDIYLWDADLRDAESRCTDNTAIGFAQISYSICSEQDGNVIMQ